MKKLSLILAAMLLAACGHSDDSPAPNPAPTADAFYARVATVVAAMPDEAEATAIDALVATAPEESEPPSL